MDTELLAQISEYVQAIEHDCDVRLEDAMPGTGEQALQLGRQEVARHIAWLIQEANRDSDWSEF